MNDWRGTKIEKGSVIVYPGRSGSVMWVNEGVVLLEPLASVPGLTVRKPDGRIVFLTKIRNVTVLEHVIAAYGWEEEELA